ncbi:universal stress protein [Pedobacter gandavensis]|uniref:universal stress protein n=1 Tax=Pedobacter gandavensis TaxID=2679963 RepID=UPI00292E3569|nr:universal stress protein [Pedobacter gandavensis]
MATSAEIGNHAGTILLLTDFSDSAYNASKYAGALAEQLNASRLLICHSEHIPTTMEIHLQTVKRAEQEHQRLLNQISDLKNDLKSRSNKTLQIDYFIDSRTLDEIVVHCHKEYGVRLLVMGISGKDPVERAFLGSNTIRIARITEIPLLIVPEHSSYRTIKNIVFACDLRKVSKTTPTLAIRHIVQELGAELSILNVSPDEQHPDRDILTEMTDLQPLWNYKKPEYHHTHHEHIAKGVTDFANEHHMQMVIAVPKTYGFFEGLFQHSLSSKLAYDLQLPILLFKEEKLQ